MTKESGNNGVAYLELHRFRCFTQLSIKPHAEFNVVVGNNASGKTSLLEALFVLGRGKSFRSQNRMELVQGREGLGRVVAELSGQSQHRLGVELGRSGLRGRCNGQDIERVSDLARLLRLQYIGPEVAQLVAGSPGNRRAFLDWMLFHVEPKFLPIWSGYRQALRQRNQALRQGVSSAALKPWDRLLIQQGVALNSLRMAAVERLQRAFPVSMPRLSPGIHVELNYQTGWLAGADYADALAKSHETDRQQGLTSCGPHRADLKINADLGMARMALSGGQQKLLSLALMLAQLGEVQQAAPGDMVLMLDDVFAELDPGHQASVLSYLPELGCQVFLTAFSVPEALPEHSMFHVEQGAVTGAS